MWILPHPSAYVLAKASGRVPREGLLGIANVIREVIPLYAMCDTMDVGASVDSSAANAPGIFVHDRFPGGLGFALKAYELIDEILVACLELLDHCACKNGCPSCVGSPLPPYSHSIRRQRAAHPGQGGACRSAPSAGARSVPAVGASDRRERGSGGKRKNCASLSSTRLR
jgi:hypothetical protein